MFFFKRKNSRIVFLRSDHAVCEVKVKVLEIDDKGRLNLSRRDALIDLDGMVPENTISDAPRRRDDRRDGHRRHDDRPRASNGFIANTNKPRHNG